MSQFWQAISSQSAGFGNAHYLHVPGVFQFTAKPSIIMAHHLMLSFRHRKIIHRTATLPSFLSSTMHYWKKQFWHSQLHLLCITSPFYCATPQTHKYHMLTGLNSMQKPTEIWETVQRHRTHCGHPINTICTDWDAYFAHTGSKVLQCLTASSCWHANLAAIFPLSSSLKHTHAQKHAHNASLHHQNVLNEIH